MLLKFTRLRSLLLSLCALVLVVSSSGVVNLLSAPKVYAQQYGQSSGRYIDGVTIIDSSGREWIDENPYDGTREYAAGPRSCRHTLRITNWGGGGNQGEATYRKPDQSGNCNVASENGRTLENITFAISDSGKREWVGYRLDDNTIWLPVASMYAGCTDNTDDSDYIDLGKPGFYRRDPDRGANTPDNQYNFVKPAGEEPPLNDRMYIRTGSGGSATLYSTTGNCSIDTIDNRDVGSFQLANGGEVTQPPDIYGVTAPSDSSGSGGEGSGETAQEDSCEGNFPFSASWFVCAAIGFLDNVLDGLLNAVDTLLDVTNDEYTNDSLKESWSYFKNIATFLLVVIGLVMIIGQAISKE